LGFSIFTNWAIIWLLTTMAAMLMYDTYSYYTTGAIAVLVVIALSVLALTSAGDWIFRISSGVRGLSEKEWEYIKPMFKEVYVKSGVTQDIELFISGDDYPNGSAMGTKTIAVSVPLLNCTPEEIKATLAHELGHIKNHDTHIQGVCSILDNLGLWALGAAIGLLTFLTDSFKIFLPFLLLVVVLKIAQVILNLLVKAIYLAGRRDMELKADRFAAQLGYRDGLVKFLNRVGDNRRTAFFSEHPLNKKRIAALTT
jgi:heat shock protein HtpX